MKSFIHSIHVLFIAPLYNICLQKMQYRHSHIPSSSQQSANWLAIHTANYRLCTTFFCILTLPASLFVCLCENRSNWGFANICASSQKRHLMLHQLQKEIQFEASDLFHFCNFEMEKLQLGFKIA